MKKLLSYYQNEPLKAAAFTAIVLVVGIVLIRKLQGALRGKIKNLQTGVDLNNLTQIPPADNIDPEQGARAAFKSEARLIADGLFQAMDGTGTAESNLYNALIPLSGWQLQEVAEAYGTKEGMNLFQWFQDELSDNQIPTNLAWDERVVGCETIWDGCSELDLMRKIWAKSGITLPF